MNGTHTTNRLMRGRGDVRRWPGRIREAGGSRTHLDRVAAGCRAVWLQPRIIQCPRQESSLVFDLRGVACKSPTLQGRSYHSAPRRGIEPRLAVPKTAVLSGTPAGLYGQVSRPGIEPGPGASEAPMRSATPSGHGSRSRRLDLHQHRAVYRTAAFLFGHSALSSSAGSRTPRGGFGDRLLARKHTAVAPGRAAGSRRNDYFCNSTFQ